MTRSTSLTTPPATPSAGASPDPTVRGGWSRLYEVLGEETSQWSTRLALTQALVATLPPFVGNRLRARALRAAGCSVGHGTVVLGRVRFTGAPNPAPHVVIGRNCVINFGCVFDAAAEITIGDEVGLGQEVFILTNGHEIGPPQRRLGALRPQPVRVGHGAWLSTRSVLLPGVTVGEGAVVAAGAVVTRSVPAHTLVGGVPARVLRELPT